MIHLFKQEQLLGVELPLRFTYPFCYTPHPLCEIAALETQKYIQKRDDWADELKQGKMFGVLVVQTPQKDIGFLAAFSGLLCGSNRHDYFVPPVYDLLSPDSFFKKEEKKISSMSKQIEKMKAKMLPYENKMEAKLEQMRKKAETELLAFKENMNLAKEQRSRRRAEGDLSEKEKTELIRESQHMSAEYKRLDEKWKKRINELQGALDFFRMPITVFEDERKQASYSLQMKLFEQYKLYNALGEKRNLCDIFRETPQQIPPAGTGECAAPKLLQYAYNNGLKPLAMAEFWWGDSPKSEVRIQGNYYPSCKQKCGPILAHMLKGLDVEPNPLQQCDVEVTEISVVYEDDWLMVVNKPSGLLSVPGKEDLPSVYDYIKEKYPDISGPLLVHRLDMDTSGLLLVAKNKEVHEQLQNLFESRKVKKRYIALLDGELPIESSSDGFIRLPLSPDYTNRPYQLVDFKAGKPAVTRYEVLGVEQIQISETIHKITRIAYYPQTGRTHQLRVHSAHPLGMNLPILGDGIYGQRKDRLYLHADKLEFKHPITEKIVKIELPAPF